jgi:excisionase family DNA binding protein
MTHRKRTITPRETADELSMSMGSVYRALKSGEIPSVRIGGKYLIPVAALNKLLDR